jgi:hypothetical protein
MSIQELASQIYPSKDGAFSETLNLRLITDITQIVQTKCQEQKQLCLSSWASAGLDNKDIAIIEAPLPTIE